MRDKYLAAGCAHPPDWPVHLESALNDWNVPALRVDCGERAVGLHRVNANVAPAGAAFGNEHRTFVLAFVVVEANRGGSGQAIDYGHKNRIGWRFDDGSVDHALLVLRDHARAVVAA